MKLLKASGKKRVIALVFSAALVLAALLAASWSFSSSGPSPNPYSPQNPQVRELHVALTFDIEDVDDDNETRAVPLVLGVLERHRAKGTFFITGKAAEKYPDMVRSIQASGHEIGLHTYEHMFPIFDRGKAEAVADAYNRSPEYVWTMSFKTPEAFIQSIESNREAIRRATGSANISLFRSPCLVPSWGENKGYFDALRAAGIRTDSSIKEDFSLDPLSSWLPSEMEGVTEVMVTRSDDMLKTVPWNIIREMRQAGVPLVIFFHPKKFSREDVGRLDALLLEIERNYDASYLTIGDISDSVG